jgi:hypothetical protein
MKTTGKSNHPAFRLLALRHEKPVITGPLDPAAIPERREGASLHQAGDQVEDEHAANDKRSRKPHRRPSPCPPSGSAVASDLAGEESRALDGAGR